MTRLAERERLRQAAPVLACLGVGGWWVARRSTYSPEALAQAEERVLAQVRAPLTHRFIQAGPYQLHTLIAGVGPPLVLLHGHGGGVGVWLFNLAALARSFRVYAVEWLGWGRSDRPPFRGQTPEEARDWWLDSLEAWRVALGLHDFTLLGHSLGGWIAAEYALRYGQHIRHLILENPAGVMNDTTLLKSVLYWVSPQRIVQRLGPLGPHLVAYGYGEQATHCPGDSQALLDYYYQLSLAPLSGQLALERILTPRDWYLPLLPRAAQLRVPTTILWGEQDTMLHRHHPDALHTALPRSRLLLLRQAGHTPHCETPALFHQAVRRSEQALPGTKKRIMLLPPGGR